MVIDDKISIDKQTNITQHGENNVQINVFSSTTQYLKGNPFKPPQPREGGLFGREKELEKLHQLLQNGKNVCVVSGMGGIGKTGLVREYANLPECTALYRNQGRYNDAKPLYLQSLDIRKRQLGNDHPHVATSLNNLTLLYDSQGQYNDAEPLYLQSLDIRKRQLGNDHPDVAKSLNNLALLYDSQGKYLKAENLDQQALVIYQQKLRNEHSNTQNAALMVKFLYIMKLLQSNKDTLSFIL